MLNDIKDWAAEKGDQSKDFAQGVANEVQTNNFMDWSGSVWIVIVGAVILMVIGMINSRT